MVQTQNSLTFGCFLTALLVFTIGILVFVRFKRNQLKETVQKSADVFLEKIKPLQKKNHFDEWYKIFRGYKFEFDSKDEQCLNEEEQHKLEASIRQIELDVKRSFVLIQVNPELFETFAKDLGRILFKNNIAYEQSHLYPAKIVFGESQAASQMDENYIKALKITSQLFSNKSYYYPYIKSAPSQVDWLFGKLKIDPNNTEAGWKFSVILDFIGTFNSKKFDTAISLEIFDFFVRKGLKKLIGLGKLYLDAVDELKEASGNDYESESMILSGIINARYKDARLIKIYY